MLQILPPRPPIPTRLRTQLEAFLVLRRNPLELWGELAYEKDILPGKFLGREQLMLNVPEAIRHVLVGNAENYRRNPATKRVLQPVLGNGLFLAEGDAWRHQRRTIAPALAPRTMPILAHHVVAATAAKAAELGRLTHRPVELLPHLQHLALAIAGQSMFSLEMSGFADELRRLLLGYGQRLAQPGVLDLMLPAHIPSLTDRRRAAFRTEWLAFLDRLIAVRSALPDQEGPGQEEGRARDLFDLLSAARDPETGAGFDHAQLRDEVSTMILAGHETTAVTLFWSLYLTALYPGQQDALAAEVAGLDLGPDQAAPSLARMPLIRAHIDESLRLYPPAFLIVRQAQAADTIMDHPVAAGTTITISPWVLHRHRARWHAPDAFDPTRFLPEATPPERYAYMPFGAGPRICVGAQFALTEASLVLASLVQRFRISLAGSGAVLPRGIVTTQPDRPVRFLIQHR
jgi:unspecific monooxygenase